ncbi:MAG: SH3 domain-containing protein [Pyrinomonadaceae bacterium]
MRFISLCLATVFLLTINIGVLGQRRPQPAKARAASTQKTKEIGGIAVVMDETLSVLRVKPSLFAESVQRMRRGRKVLIQGVTEADGVRFYRVSALPGNTGWVQADAVFGRFREGDDARLARLIQASNGFDQIELASSYFELYPQSQFRPALLLLFGDLLEEAAAKLSKDAGSRLDRREMAASAAPMHSYYLNFNMLDRYRKLGVIFLFNSANRSFHYDGRSWREIVQKFAATNESAEAEKRLDSLKQKMETGPAK